MKRAIEQAGRLLRPKQLHFLTGGDMRSVIATLLLVTLLVCTSPAAAQETPVLSLKSSIALPNVKGRIDHFSVDVKGQRLFMAGVGNHTLEVIDLQSGKRVRTIPDLAEPQGVYFDAATNHLYVACGLDGVTKIYDGTTFRPGSRPGRLSSMPIPNPFGWRRKELASL
jgi:hypothetical protein